MRTYSIGTGHDDHFRPGTLDGPRVDGPRFPLPTGGRDVDPRCVDGFVDEGGLIQRAEYDPCFPVWFGAKRGEGRGVAHFNV